MKICSGSRSAFVLGGANEYEFLVSPTVDHQCTEGGLADSCRSIASRPRPSWHISGLREKQIFALFAFGGRLTIAVGHTARLNDRGCRPNSCVEWVEDVGPRHPSATLGRVNSPTIVQVQGSRPLGPFFFLSF